MQPARRRRGDRDAQWTPSASPVSPGVWTMATNASPGRVYAGGDFTRISGQSHQHFARFSEDPNNTSETLSVTSAADASVAAGVPAGPEQVDRPALTPDEKGGHRQSFPVG